MSVSQDYTASEGHHFFQRSTVIDLEDVFRTQSNTQSKYIHLYCDTLSWNNQPSSGQLRLAEFVPAQWKYVHIFARRFLPDATSLTLDLSDLELRVRIYYQYASSALKFSRGDTSALLCPPGFAEPKGEWTTLEGVKNTTSTVGREIIASRSTFVASDLFQVPFSETDPPVAQPKFRGETMLKAVGGSRQVKEKGSAVPIHLGTFLTNLFNDACASMMDATRQVHECIYKLRFVIACCKASVKLSHLSACSMTLLERLELPLRSAPLLGEARSVFHISVPRTTLKNYLDELESSYGPAQEIQDKIQDLTSVSDTEEYAKAVLKGIGMTVLFFSQGQTTEKELNDGLLDIRDREIALKNAADAMDEARKAFEIGFQEYKKAEENKIYSEIFQAVGMFAFDAVVAVATCGAGAPLATGNINKVVKLVEKTQTAITKADKIKDLLKKLGAAAVKLAPRIQASSKSAQALRSAEGQSKDAKEKLVNQASKLVTSSSAYPDSAVERFDYIGLTADWEEFKITIDESFDEMGRAIEGATISGYDAFRSTLRKMCVQGQALLEARRVSQQTSANYYRELAKAANAKTQKTEIERLLSPLNTKAESKKMVNQFAMMQLSEELATMKRSMFLLIHACVSSLAYQTTMSSYPVQDDSIRPDMELAKFGTIQAGIRHAQNAHHEKSNIPQRMTLRLRTHDDTFYKIFGTAWKSILVDEGKIYLNVRHDLPLFKNWCQLRVEDVTVTLHDLKQRSPSEEPIDLSYQVCFGPELMDHSAKGEVVQYYTEPIKVQKHILASQGEKGWVAEGNMHIRPTPMASIFVALDPDGLEYFDLSSVTDISMELNCIGSLKSKRP